MGIWALKEVYDCGIINYFWLSPSEYVGGLPLLATLWLMVSYN